jgi:hypothetical protein
MNTAKDIVPPNRAVFQVDGEISTVTDLCDDLAYMGTQWLPRIEKTQFNHCNVKIE